MGHLRRRTSRAEGAAFWRHLIAGCEAIAGITVEARNREADLPHVDWDAELLHLTGDIRRTTTGLLSTTEPDFKPNPSIVMPPCTSAPFTPRWTGNTPAPAICTFTTILDSHFTRQRGQAD